MRLSLAREPGRGAPVAWVDHVNGEPVPVVHVRAYRLKLPLALPVVAHEVEHILDKAFTDAAEHPWWHFCGRTDKLSLGTWHLRPMSVVLARSLLAGQEPEVRDA